MYGMTKAAQRRYNRMQRRVAARRRKQARRQRQRELRANGYPADVAAQIAAAEYADQPWADDGAIGMGPALPDELSDPDPTQTLNSEDEIMPDLNGGNGGLVYDAPMLGEPLVAGVPNLVLLGGAALAAALFLR